jgi:hypothetical protein
MIECDYFMLKKDNMDNYRQDTHKRAYDKIKPNST